MNRVIKAFTSQHAQRFPGLAKYFTHHSKSLHQEIKDVILNQFLISSLLLSLLLEKHFVSIYVYIRFVCLFVC